MLLNGISSCSLNPISIILPNVSVFSLPTAALYTAGCAVSLKKGEKKILT
jgi:hypothetical protein